MDRSGLRPGDAIVAGRVLALLLPAVTLRNRVALPRLIRLFESSPRHATPRRDRLDRARRLTDGILHRFFGGGFCMKRALVLYHFMTRANVPGRIVFGVARNGESLKGHAWLEVEGRPYCESEDVSGFRIVYAHPGSGVDEVG